MHEETDIRPAAMHDLTRVCELAVVNDMFAEDELDDFTEMFGGAVNGDLEGHQWFVASRGGNMVSAAAYVAPEPFADRVWNLYFIAVDPSEHGRGLGTDLMDHVEGLLRSAGPATARVLLVETSSTGQYEATRAFYLARGFDEEARIRDFYGPDDHKVVFWKAVAA